MSTLRIELLTSPAQHEDIRYLVVPDSHIIETNRRESKVGFFLSVSVRESDERGWQMIAAYDNVLSFHRSDKYKEIKDNATRNGANAPNGIPAPRAGGNRRR